MSKPCKCGHVKGDHQSRANKGVKIRVECMWDDCDCIRYDMAYDDIENKRQYCNRIMDMCE